jgi:hypothetical protein
MPQLRRRARPPYWTAEPRSPALEGLGEYDTFFARPGSDVHRDRIAPALISLGHAGLNGATRLKSAARRAAPGSASRAPGQQKHG